MLAGKLGACDPSGCGAGVPCRLVLGAAELPEPWIRLSQRGEQAKAAAVLPPGFAAMEVLATAVHNDVGTRSATVLRDAVEDYRSVIAAASAGTLAESQTRSQTAQSAVPAPGRPLG